MMKTTMIENYGEVTVTEGTAVHLDTRRVAERLLPSDWEAAEFRFPCWALGSERVKGVACNVTVTGRTFKVVQGQRWVRCKVEFVGDGEPSTFVGGWVLVR